MGVLTVFETRKGIEKMPVVLTGKSKLHVFSLRRAKGNKACILCRFSPFFTVSEMFLSTLFKKKKLPYRECVEGKPSLAGLPRTLFRSALRIRVSIIAMIDRGLCPLDTHKPLKRLDLNFLTSHSGRFFTHTGVLAVFKPRRGSLKIPVAPTGKLKLHVFPLRRAKGNKGLAPSIPTPPLKKVRS